MECEDEYFESEAGTDSDEELQEAFRTGKLKPGLNTVRETIVKQTVNNEKAMLAKLEEFRLQLPWLERLDLVCRPAPMAPELRQEVESVAMEEDSEIAEDDFKRETLFYRLSQAAVLEGIPRLQELGIATKRPDDYLAQMAKSDQQMDKVRKFLIQQKSQKEMSEKARKLRAMKKHGKQTQVDAEQRKARQKRDMLDKVKKFRKGKEKSLDFLDDMKEEGRAAQRKPAGNKAGGSARRQHKDERFGFGGRKRGLKRNTADSTADSGWIGAKGKKAGGRSPYPTAGAGGRPDKGPKGHGKGPQGRGKGPQGRGKGTKSKRPGKTVRQNKRNKGK